MTRQELGQIREALWATVRFVNPPPSYEKPKPLDAFNFPGDKVYVAICTIDRELEELDAG